MTTTQGPLVAYFSMEVGVANHLPTFSGGLGVLAGDTLKAAADLGVPMIGVTLLHRRGYFRQKLEASGRQLEEDLVWNVAEHLTPTVAAATVHVANRAVKVSAWRHDIKGAGGHVVPLYFLDCDHAENAPEDRRLTDHLYGGDERYRLSQEVVLGIGGVKILAALGYELKGEGARGIGTFHMNEGHAALLTLGLVEATGADWEWLRKRGVFTTHTPVAAGHDHFSWDLAAEVLGKAAGGKLQGLLGSDERLNMTRLALKCARYTNGVAKRHGEVSRAMFPGHDIHSVTNGIHSATWAHPALATLLDRKIPDWRRDNHQLRNAWDLDLEELAKAHAVAKQDLLTLIEQRQGVKFDPNVFTIGFARRAATYKRADLVFADPAHLARIAAANGGLQIVFAGKAHPRDEGGKALIKSVIAGAAAAGPSVKTAYMENYDMELGAVITAGVDLWLNTPLKPLEASGTSGMKAALNGVPSLSTLDGWWVEGHLEGVTGWEIEDEADGLSATAEDFGARKRASDSLYLKLERDIVPMYRQSTQAWRAVMRNCIAVNASFFNTHRMVAEYQLQAY